MTRRPLYLALALIGAVVPYLFFFDFLRTESALLQDFVAALFVNGAAGGFAADLLITSTVFWLFLFPEASRLGIRRPWLYVVINLAVGLSCALPLFLAAREGRLARRDRAGEVESLGRAATAA